MARCDQGCQRSHGVPEQNHTISRQRQALLVLRLEHGLKIPLSLLQRPGSIKGFTAVQQGLDSGRIAAGMLQQHHRPSRCRQMPGQPLKMVGTTTKSWHQRDPEPVPPGGRWFPEPQRQGIGAMRHRQLNRETLDWIAQTRWRERACGRD